MNGNLKLLLLANDIGSNYPLSKAIKNFMSNVSTVDLFTAIDIKEAENILENNDITDILIISSFKVYDFIRDCNNKYPYKRILLMTGNYESEDFHNKINDLKIDHLLKKPVTVHNLLDILLAENKNRG